MRKDIRGRAWAALISHLCYCLRIENRRKHWQSRVAWKLLDLAAVAACVLVNVMGRVAGARVRPQRLQLLPDLNSSYPPTVVSLDRSPQETVSLLSNPTFDAVTPVFIDLNRTHHRPARRTPANFATSEQDALLKLPVTVLDDIFKMVSIFRCSGAGKPFREGSSEVLTKMSAFC